MTRIDRLISRWAIPAAIVIVGVVALLSYCGRAHAEPPCGPRQQMLGFVAGQYGETVRRTELAFTQGKFVGLLEWTENEAMTTWSVLITSAGKTCLLFSGTRKAGFPS